MITAEEYCHRCDCITVVGMWESASMADKTAEDAHSRRDQAITTDVRSTIKVDD